MQIGLLEKSDNSFVLGAAFFTAFVGIFDTETGQIGFAESTRALPGSSMRCLKNCGGPDDPDDKPIGPDPNEEPSYYTTKNAVFLIIALVVIAVLVCGAVYWCRKRSSNSRDAQVGQGRSKRGKKKGYSMQDERDDDSDEEESIAPRYAKPRINN